MTTTTGSHVTLPVEMVQILREDGTLVGEPPDLSDDDLIEIMRWMRMGKWFDQRMISLQRQGKSATYAPCVGQEASIVGSAWALEHATDWIVHQYREAVALAMHGFPLSSFVLYLRGHPLGNMIPEGVRALPVQIAIASQILHGVGLAWGLKLQKKPGVVIAYFGDGATSEGGFHEAANFAGVMKAPVVLFCQNNGWAISTPRARQTASETIAQKAVAYGFPGVQVDGNDVLAVYKVTREAVERARDGGGPTLIEAMTYRIGSHTTADDATRYRSPEELEAQLKRDPVSRFARYLESRGIWSPEREAEVDAEVAQYVSDATDEAEKQGFVTRDAIFNNVFADPPSRLIEQRDSLAKEG